MNHLPGRGMGPLSLIDLVSKDHRQIERSCNVYGPKHPWSTINRKMNSSRIGLSPKGHSVVELDDHPRVENRRGVINGSKEYLCTTRIESMSSRSAAKAGRS